MGDCYTTDDIAGYIAQYVIFLFDAMDNLTRHVKFLDDYVDHSRIRITNGIVIT